MFKTRKCSGLNQAFSLIESAIVLGIIGIVIGGIWVAAASMFNNYKDRDLMEGTTFIYTEMQKLIPSSVYTGTTLYLQTEDGGGHKAITMGIIPAHWVNGNKVVSGYGPVEITISSNLIFRITLFLPPESCRRFVQTISSNPSYKSGGISPAGWQWNNTSGYSIGWRQSGCQSAVNKVASEFEFVLQ